MRHALPSGATLRVTGLDALRNSGGSSKGIGVLNGTLLAGLGALIGLGVAIDYSLLLVTRWREERAHGHQGDEAVHHAMAGTGRAVVFSGATVAIGLVALVFPPVPFLRWRWRGDPAGCDRDPGPAGARHGVPVRPLELVAAHLGHPAAAGQALAGGPRARPRSAGRAGARALRRWT
jgi:MMPL family